jgi:hypothetical protein
MAVSGIGVVVLDDAAVADPGAVVGGVQVAVGPEGHTLGAHQIPRVHHEGRSAVQGGRVRGEVGAGRVDGEARDVAGADSVHQDVAIAVESQPQIRGDHVRLLVDRIIDGGRGRRNSGVRWRQIVAKDRVLGGGPVRHQQVGMRADAVFQVVHPQPAGTARRAAPGGAEQFSEILPH